MHYQWWVFVHLVGVFGFLSAHGVSVAVALRLREERDPARVASLLELSARTVPALYVSLAVLLVGGIVATFLGDLWSFGWIWAAIATLALLTLSMIGMARPYYRRVRLISRALAEGSTAVTAEQYDEVLRSRRPITITWIGAIGLGFILYLMVVKPSLGLAPGAEPPPAGAGGRVVEVASVNSRFSPTALRVPAGRPFTLRFVNRDAGVPHNIAIYAGAGASRPPFTGRTFPGSATRSYAVPALGPGSYLFRCDVHPTTMTGALEAR